MADHPLDDDYIAGFVDPFDRGLRLRRQNRKGEIDVYLDGSTLVDSGEGEGELPENLVTYNGDPVVYEGSYVTHA